MFAAISIFCFLFFKAPERILEIVIEGNKVYTAEEIRGSMHTKVGETLDAKVLQQDIVFLWQNKRVRADVSQEEVPGGVRLTIRVEEVPAIRDVFIRGNRNIKREDLFDAAKLTPGVPIDLVVASRARADLIQYYRDQGYYFAEIQLKYERDINRMTFEVMEGPLVKVSSIEFEGNHAIPSSYIFNLRQDLDSVMKIHGKFLFFGASEFKESTLREDLIQLRRLYRREGFRDAVVELKELEFNEDRDRVVLHILVYEGPRYVVDQVDLEGAEAFPKEELMSLLKLKPGDFYSEEFVDRDRRALERYYGERGYPAHPSISDHWMFGDPKDRLDPYGPKEIYLSDEAKVKVIYRIHEGKKIKIRDVQIQGNQVTQDRVVRRQLAFYPGEYVNTSEIAKSFQRLSSLNYFKDERGMPGLRYSFADTDKPDEKDVLVQVTEGETGQLQFGGGINSAEGFFARILLQKNNFDLFDPPSSFGNIFKETFDGTAFTGAGQYLVLSLEPGTRISTYQILFREPDLFGQHIRTTSFDFNIFNRRRFFQEYEEDRTGVRLTVSKNWTERFGSYLSLDNEYITLKGLSADAPTLVFDIEGGNTQRSLELGLVYSDLDVPLDPTQGYALRLATEAGGGILGGNFDFYKEVLDGRFYVPAMVDDRGRTYTLFLHSAFSMAQAFDDSNQVPFPVRFFTGGPDSIRGFSFRGVGPVQNNHPTGGEALALASAEFRFPLYSTPFAEGLAETEWIRGVFFVDSGALGLDIHDPSFRDWRVSAGTGVRIKLPFMPQAAIVLDYGIPIFKQETDTTRFFSFSIGTSF